MTSENTKNHPVLGTGKQHLIPPMTITNFLNASGTVNIRELPSNEEMFVKPENPIFSASREMAPSIKKELMDSIEMEYHLIVSNLIKDPKKALSSDENKIISDMYCLWNVRSFWYQRTHKNMLVGRDMPVTALGFEYTAKESAALQQVESGDKKPKFTKAARFIEGFEVSRNFRKAREHMANNEWRVNKTQQGELIFPDNSMSVVAIPISPNLLLSASNRFDDFNIGLVSMYNRYALSTSHNFVFCKDFKACPTKEGGF